MTRPANSIALPNDEFFSRVEELLSKGTAVTINCCGKSMLPFLRPATDAVRIERTSDYSVGDIILARDNHGRVILHRIIAIETNGYTLMGDGNLQATEQCRYSDIMGKVTTITRRKAIGKIEIDPQSRAMRFKYRLWLWLCPIRRILLAIIRLFIN